MLGVFLLIYLCITHCFCVKIASYAVFVCVIIHSCSIIPTAFLATSLIFICFTLSSLLAEDRKWLALGGENIISIPLFVVCVDYADALLKALDWGMLCLATA